MGFIYCSSELHVLMVPCWRSVLEGICLTNMFLLCSAFHPKRNIPQYLSRDIPILERVNPWLKLWGKPKVSYFKLWVLDILSQQYESCPTQRPNTERTNTVILVCRSFISPIWRLKNIKNYHSCNNLLRDKNKMSINVKNFNVIKVVTNLE